MAASIPPGFLSSSNYSSVQESKPAPKVVVSGDHADQLQRKVDRITTKNFELMPKALAVADIVLPLLSGDTKEEERARNSIYQFLESFQPLVEITHPKYKDKFNNYKVKQSTSEEAVEEKREVKPPVPVEISHPEENKNTQEMIFENSKKLYEEFIDLYQQTADTQKAVDDPQCTETNQELTKKLDAQIKKMNELPISNVELEQPQVRKLYDSIIHNFEMAKIFSLKTEWATTYSGSTLHIEHKLNKLEREFSDLHVKFCDLKKNMHESNDKSTIAENLEKYKKKHTKHINKYTMLSKNAEEFKEELKGCLDLIKSTHIDPSKQEFVTQRKEAIQIWDEELREKVKTEIEAAFKVITQESTELHQRLTNQWNTIKGFALEKAINELNYTGIVLYQKNGVFPVKDCGGLFPQWFTNWRFSGPENEYAKKPNLEFEQPVVAAKS